MEFNMQNKSKVKKSKSAKHKKKRSEKSILNGDDDSDDLSLTKELHSIGHYVNDRQEMIEQMFSTMSEEKLRAMLPPILKDESISTLQSNCLEALLGMSSKRIKSILAGEDLGSQSSDTESDESHQSNSSLEDQDDKEAAPVATAVVPKPSEGENLLEMVELQLRARAIRAALVHQCVSPEPLPEIGDFESSKPEDKSTKVKEKEILKADTPRVDNIADNVIIVLDSPEERNAAEDFVDEQIKEKTIEVTAPPIIVPEKPVRKRNVVMIGPKRKTKSKIVYDSKIPKVLAIDTADKVSETVNGATSIANNGETNAAATVLSKEEGETMEVDNTYTARIHSANKEDTTKDQDEASQSWMQRWLHVQETDSTNAAQKKTSKIITTVKQKLRDESKKLEEAKKTDEQTPVVQQVLEVAGTVCEYEQLPPSALAVTLADETAAVAGTDVVEGIPAEVDETDVVEESGTRDVDKGGEEVLVERVDENEGLVEKGENEEVEERGNEQVDSEVLVEDVEEGGDEEVKSEVLVEESGDEGVESEEDVVEASRVKKEDEAAAVMETDGVTEAETTAEDDQADDAMCGDELELHYDDIDDDMLPKT